MPTNFKLDHPSKARRKHADRLTPVRFRARVWSRDGGQCRATGFALYVSDVRPSHRGNVCHLKGRRVMPEWKTDPRRAVLMSEAMHILSDARGSNLLKLTDPETGEPATDGDRKIRFTLYGRDGVAIWTRTS